MQLKFCQRKKIIDYFGECKARAKAHGLINSRPAPAAKYCYSLLFLTFDTVRLTIIFVAYYEK